MSTWRLFIRALWVTTGVALTFWAAAWLAYFVHG